MVYAELGRQITPSDRLSHNPLGVESILNPDPISVFLQTAADLFHENPNELMTIQSVHNTEALNAQALFIYLLAQANVPKRRIQEIFSTTKTIMDFRFHHHNYLMLHNPDLKKQVNILENNLPWISEKNDMAKLSNEVELTVTDYFGVSWKDVISPSKARVLDIPKFTAAHLFTEAGLKLKAVALALGRTNHTTIIHALRELKEIRDTDEMLDSAIPVMEDGIGAIRRRRELNDSIDRIIESR